MADTGVKRSGAAELKKTASSLQEIGLGASRRNDRELAQIYLGLAAKFFDRANDTASAASTRDLVRLVG